MKRPVLHSESIAPASTLQKIMNFALKSGPYYNNVTNIIIISIPPIQNQTTLSTM